jgi:23S rRNA (uracil1939-C5)-methyltransferase
LLLTIEKLIYGGDGLARLPADERGRGKAVFVPFVLAGEKVEAVLALNKSGFARARAEAVVESSPQRIAPGCPHFGSCGGCHYQHTGYEHQLEIKKEILRENLRRISKLELTNDIVVHPSPPWNYRNRSRLQVQTRPAFAAGYFKFGSHQLLPVEHCPISSPLINRGIASLWKNGRAGTVPNGILEVEFFASADDTRVLAEITCIPELKRGVVRSWAEDWQSSMPEIAGIVAFRQRRQDQRAGASDLLVSLGDARLIYQTRMAAYQVSAGAFFQTNRFLTDELVKIVTEGESGDFGLDLYAGVGLFSTALACDFRHIVSVEASQTAASDLKYNLPLNGKAIQATAEDYLSGASSRGRPGKDEALPSVGKPDLVVVDPPRSGLGESVVRWLAELDSARITYVSCDPATLARDLIALLGAGYKVEQTHLVDLFPQTFHLESVVKLRR